VLQRDGRVTNHRLAGLVGLSPSACLARVRRLEQTGVITGYRGSRDRLLKTAR
jgi:Lrp/AsnC family leucine-responsive transcriptional regulator